MLRGAGRADFLFPLPAPPRQSPLGRQHSSGGGGGVVAPRPLRYQSLTGHLLGTYYLPGPLLSLPDTATLGEVLVRDRCPTGLRVKDTRRCKGQGPWAQMASLLTSVRSVLVTMGLCF